MEPRDRVWMNEGLSRLFLDNVRGAIPFAEAQIESMMRVIDAALPEVVNFLDLGCGDGILGRAILEKYPNAQGTFIDFSETMLNEAKRRYTGQGNAEFIVSDFGRSRWLEDIKEGAPFNVIVSGYAIHHQSDERKKQLYGEIFGLLSPGGVFVNVEHVSSSTKWLGSVSDNLFIDSLYAFHKKGGSTKSREEMAHDFFRRPDKDANILAPVEVQCEWLRSIGFKDVDCYFKAFELAVFGGRRPSEEANR